MDCNSIIYDVVRKMESDPELSKHITNDRIIDGVISKIRYYAKIIEPTNVMYVAFDGVAPFAKMEQQRIRRYKNGYLSAVDFEHDNGALSLTKSSSKWNTSAITPGTDFMTALSAKVRRAFSDDKRTGGAKTVIVSPSDEAGEGEHKMFQYMRDHALKDESIAVYGLDSDLIMLSLFHCFACDNIYIFRESPSFGKAILQGQFGEDELIFLDNRDLSKAILKEMGVMSEANDARGRIYDYIFMCFLLGNDFLPHFPALNIRTHGNFTALETYKRIIGNRQDRRFIGLETGNIQWRWVKAFLQELSKSEPRLILEEYDSRSKMESRFYPTTTKQERETAFDNIPVIYRAEEHYINPRERGWESRYYRVAFHLDEPPEKTFVSEVCHNYLEGLEWVFKYYTEGCPHWRWKYRYHYPPLFKDLVEFVPNFETEFINSNSGINRPFKQQTQLAYVIPIWNNGLLSEKTNAAIKKLGMEKYYTECGELKFQWMFCRYFWEAHALLKEHPLAELEKLDALL